MLDDLIEAKRGGICDIKGNRLVNTSEKNKTIWYFDPNQIYGWAMMQKLLHKDFKYTATSPDNILNTPDNSDFGYYIICDIDYTDDYKDKTEQLSLMPNKRKIIDNELEYRQREKGRARTEKQIFDQNNKYE